MDLRKERTLKYLSQSLVDLMGGKPLAQITVSEICDNAMVRRATFYRHFKSKDELLSYVLTQRREAIRERSRDADSDMSIARYCEVMIRELAAYIGDHRRDIVRQRLSPEFVAEVQLIVDDIGRDFAYRLAISENEEAAAEDRIASPANAVSPNEASSNTEPPNTASFATASSTIASSTTTSSATMSSTMAPSNTAPSATASSATAFSNVMKPSVETCLVANFYAAGLMGAVRWWFNECPDQAEAPLIEALNEVSAKLFSC